MLEVLISLGNNENYLGWADPEEPESGISFSYQVRVVSCSNQRLISVDVSFTFAVETPLSTNVDQTKTSESM